MIRRPPRATRTDTLFPYTTLFRACRSALGRDRVFRVKPVAPQCAPTRLDDRHGFLAHGPHMTPQLDANGRLRHLLTLEGLPRDTLVALLDRAQAFVDGESGRSLAGTAVCTLFFEPSTRTRLSFQRAAQRLGADVLNFDASTSSTTKGETALDTLKNIEAMGVRGFVVRHSTDGAVAELAAAAGQDTALLNAGDGRNAHPTQGLLDMLTLRQAKGTDFSALKVLVVGDIRHSRVARSDLQALRTLGAGEVRDRKSTRLNSSH